MSAEVRSLRLDRLLANLGYGSRRDIQLLARDERIILDGAPVDAPNLRIALDRDLPRRLAVDGEPVDPLPGLVLMLNKPLGVTCSHKDAGPLVYSLLPPRWRRRDPALSTVGRLDKETSGLLLLTDDGGLLHRIISPRAHVTKRYRASLARPIGPEAVAIFASGRLMLDGETEPLQPAVLRIETPTAVRVTVTEGRYHQIRRMFAALGNHVDALEREAMGGLVLPPGLDPGQYRHLEPAEIAQIFAVTNPEGES